MFCINCGKGFTSAEDLKKHHQNKHENHGTLEKSFPCGECMRVFKSNSSLRRH